MLYFDRYVCNFSIFSPLNQYIRKFSTQKSCRRFFGRVPLFVKRRAFFNVLQRKLDMPPVCVYFIQNSSTTLLPKKNSDFISLMTCVLYVRSVTT